jgi:type II secretory pathway pseudopilin PulG
MKTRKKAITLIEMAISLVLASILLAVILKIFTSGMKESANALTHQDNMETANILMSQIEYDLNKATEIISPNWNEKDSSAQWVFSSKSSLGKITFTYDHIANSANGVHRFVTGKDTKEDYYFAKGHPVNLKFTHIVVKSDESNNSMFENHGMWVELDVGSIKGDVATYTLKRLIVLNH